MMDSNSIYGLSHFFNPVTGQTTVSICYSQENSDDYFILEYHDGQKFVPYDGINGVVYKTPQPIEIKYDTSTDFYDNIVKEVYIGEDKYLPASGAVYLPAYSTIQKLIDLKDVSITAPIDGDALTYNPTEEKWINEVIRQVQNQNGGTLKFWAGSKAEYDAILNKDANTLYFYTEPPVE